MAVGPKGYLHFRYASLVFKQLTFMIFHKNELFWIKLTLLKIENYY